MADRTSTPEHKTTPRAPPRRRSQPARAAPRSRPDADRGWEPDDDAPLPREVMRTPFADVDDDEDE